ncbi:MAG: type I secretion C-terminal target domain-containing protein, partial [Oceanospirillales bacterium]|nr:type I secretion C-terminal target domain-containing protein [Oceanospirillales bacterium]MBR9887713.1 type I secretion C-terminal target domain-containing protein [Oceanospirillales bacterium]
DDSNGHTTPVAVDLTELDWNGTPPTADDKNLNTKEDTPIIVTLSGNDIDGDLASFKIAMLPDNGILYRVYEGPGDPANEIYVAGESITATSGQADLVFVPNENFGSNTAITFNYTATDAENGVSEPALVEITVERVADTVGDSLDAYIGEETVVSVDLGNTDNAIITTADGTSNGEVTSIEYSDGTIITPESGTYLYTSTGQGLGIGTNGDFRINEGDALNVDLPTYLTEIALVFKNASGQTFTFTTMNVDGSQSVIEYTFSGGANSLSSFTLSSDIPFNEFSFEVIGQSQGGNGSTLVSIGTDSVTQTSYVYPLTAQYDLIDMDGSELISEITISGFPAGTDILIYEADNDGVTEVTDNGDGTWTILPSAFTEVNGVYTINDLVIQSASPLPDGFKPQLEITLSDGIDTSISIQGGTEVTELVGGDGNDLLIGSDIDNILSGGVGDDILIGGAGNDIMTGGAGSDSFVWNGGDQGTTTIVAQDHITDFTVADDSLDLSDLLDSLGMTDVGVVESYLSLADNGSNQAVLSVKDSVNGSVVQEIVLDNVNIQGLKTDLSLDPGATNTDLLNQLIDQSKLIV